MEFDPFDKKIRFRKNEGKSLDEKFELAFEFEEGDEIHPCVNLRYTGDEVQIINNIDI